MKKNYQYLIMAAAFAVAVTLSVMAGTPAIGGEQQKIFATPDQAIRMLLDACRTNDHEKLVELFGAGNKDIIVTRDTAQDAYGRKKFYQLASERLIRENKGKNTIILVAGKMEFPFPFPLVKEAAGWHFDSAAGREEIINRRVGRDELNAIAICRAYVKAQREYASKDRNNDDVMEYATKFPSSPGKHDGLYWTPDPSRKGDVSPLGPLFTGSKRYLSARKQGAPYYGYYYRILTKQGANAPSGAHDYFINGHMVAGFAMIAYPADYGTSGVTTFIVNQRGKVYQKDLGTDTLKIAEEMIEYNPDKTWKLVQENGMLATD